ncbi:LytR family transcriptional regulator [Nocardioides marmoriginsengisoli]|uniref:LytR family transcriptional regulator n=1 Tax=Nocardioides marmoriginsengisoli TaxID=661483 RepID=A0A3N0CS03_9ACTN|nr:LytR C-terminal domain-containing protein [Nocardioides marmoriginsengisoli]RNL66139.1 LytR family transcriptional regulator [Nocardioides marmoriginsengisoli]
MFGNRRLRDQGGFVLPTRLMVFSVSVIALAGLVFVATQGDDDSPAKANPAANTSSAPLEPGGTDPSTPVITPTTTPKPPPVVKRGRTNVVIFNNTNVKGLAGKTATRASKVGWNILTTDNWQGNVDTSTVYYGPKLKAAAQLLADDLGINRIKASFAPMNPKNLTVILTDDYR